jgi:hypothetical protein
MATNNDDEKRPEPVENAPVEQTLNALDGFVRTQRQLFALDWVATDLAANMSQQLGSVAKLAEIQKSIASKFSQSVNITAVLAAQEALSSQAMQAAVAPAVAAWAESVRHAVDFSALNDALRSAVAFDLGGLAGDSLHKVANDLSASLRAPAQGFVLDVSKLDFGRLHLDLDQAIPGNLRDAPFEELEKVSIIGTDEGIPLANIPGPVLVRDLVAANSFEERAQMLQDRASEVLDDCARTVGEEHGPFAEQCTTAMHAYREGHIAPAQSHAANIVDSILRNLFDGDVNKKARQRASKSFDELPLRLLAEHLALGPLLKALVPCKPSQGLPVPKHFSRHATAHAAGHEGVFGPTQGLVAVMLASSLTIQFGRESADL